MATQRRTPKAAKKRKAHPPRGKTPPQSTAPRRVSARGESSAHSQTERGARERPPGRPAQTPAFFADARHATDALAEELGESFVLSATSGEDSEEYYERERPEEEGGPFLETSARTEFAYGVDESNPEDAEPAPWPAVSPGQPPPHRPGGPR
jgi:hypothetical protein